MALSGCQRPGSGQGRDFSHELKQEYGELFPGYSKASPLTMVLSSVSEIEKAA